MEGRRALIALKGVLFLYSCIVNRWTSYPFLQIKDGICFSCWLIFRGYMGDANKVVLQ